MQVVVNLRIK